MPLDAMMAGLLREELAQRVTGLKIDKVRQPEKDSILLLLRGSGRTEKLLLCAAGGSARVCLTETDYENPPQPPMFCMLLRKYLQGGVILAVEQPPLERLLLFRVEAFDELGERASLTLAAEFLGRNANVLLVGPDGRIIDALRRVDAEMSPVRPLMPGMLYRLPPQPQSASFTGFSPLVREELEFRGLPVVADSLQGLDKRPYLLYENGELKDFCFLPILCRGGSWTSEERGGWSELLECFYAEKDRLMHVRSRAHSLLKLTRGALGRTEKKLALRRQELLAAADMDLCRRRADLITANIWRMKPGMNELVCEDFYEEDAPPVHIPLDTRKTPQQNAAAYYKSYSKKKTAREHLTRLVAENETELDYLRSVSAELDRAESRQDLEDISAELTQAGYIKEKRDNRKKRSKPSAPRQFFTPTGLRVLAGRNNLQNDYLTFRLAGRYDFWFHAQQLHGAHVILCCEGKPPDEVSVSFAASVAAYYSEGAAGGRVAVDYTQTRFVKKPHGAKPGKVIYTDYKTIMAPAQKPVANEG